MNLENQIEHKIEEHLAQVKYSEWFDNLFDGVADPESDCELSDDEEDPVLPTKPTVEKGKGDCCGKCRLPGHCGGHKDGKVSSH
jgi:hypothetical protein